MRLPQRKKGGGQEFKHYDGGFNHNDNYGKK